MTVLAAPISDTTRTIRVDAGIANPTYPLFRTLDSETIKVTGGATGTSWQVERGVGDTRAAEHIAGTALVVDSTPYGESGGSGIPQGGPLTENLDADGFQINNLSEPVAETDAMRAGSATLGFVLSIGADAGGAAIINLADPTDPQDAATKASVSAAIASATIRTAAGVPSGAPTGTEVPFAYNTTAVSGGFYYWNGAAWVKVATIL